MQMSGVWSGRCYVLGGVFLVVLCFESAMRVWVFFLGKVGPC